MNWMKAVLREVAGLFVDDLWFAGAIVVWVGLVVAVSRSLTNADWGGLALFVGLALILVGSAVRFARKASRRR
jgi:hypothetical protein